MFTWIDGRLLLAFIVLTALSFLICCAFNGRMVDRAHRRNTERRNG